MRPGRISSFLLTTPIGLLLLLGVVVPSLIMFLYSFYRATSLQVTADLNIESYKQVLTDSTYRPFFVNTVAIAFPVMIVSVLGGFTIAYYLAFHAGRARSILLAMVVISMMGSYLVRIYSWRTLLGENGIINSALASTGLTDSSLGFLIFNRQAVVLAEANYLMPFSALLFFAALSGVSPEVQAAARDLGAGTAPGPAPRDSAPGRASDPGGRRIHLLPCMRRLHHPGAARWQRLDNLGDADFRSASDNGRFAARRGLRLLSRAHFPDRFPGSQDGSAPRPYASEGTRR